MDHYITVSKEIKSLTTIYSERGDPHVNLIKLAEKNIDQDRKVTTPC